MISNPPALEKFKNRISWKDIKHEKLRSYLQICLEEEIGAKSNNKRSDLTSEACNISQNGAAKLVARENLTICGLPLIEELLTIYNANSLSIELFFEDGDCVSKGDAIARIKGNQKLILLTERTILNFIQKLSGIATKAHWFSKVTESDGVHLLDTRKTTPGLRELEKYASACGGSYNHRMGLYDRILIKDNHLAAKGIIKMEDLCIFLSKIKKKNPEIITEVEIDDIKYLIPAIESGIDAVLLDNFNPDQVKESVKVNQNRVVLESSGGINENSLKEFSKAKPHFISSGAPVHSSRWMDVGLDWE